MIIVVGLGNFGKEYDKTYHNMGFMAIDKFAEKLGCNFSKKDFKSLVAEGRFNGEKILLAKPQTYMNLSGEAVVLLKKKFKDARIIVLVDCIDIMKGEVRYREKGSAGTHNGLRNIVSYIGEDFERIKIGIGRDESMDLKDFVLSKVDMNFFDEVLDNAVNVLVEKISK